MKANINNNENNIKVIERMNNENVSIEILEFEELRGGSNVSSSIMLSFMKDSNIKLRQVKITLNNTQIRLEAGALSYLKGNIEMNNKIGGIMGLGKKFLKGSVTGETTFKPKYSGTGEIYLEPSFGHYVIIELENEEVIVDDGVFYACEDSVEVGAAMQKNVSSAVLGQEGLFQTKLCGSGFVVLEVPVPKEEIIEHELNNETLKVDGNFAILRTGNINFTVETSSKSLIGSATSGEGLLNVFRGTGKVWLIPTKHVYSNLTNFGLYGMTNPGGKSNTKA
ncbi:AIM24 family protein [Tepidibacter aestuarii]|uniref:AIM24 family protein n=1 Tax=Tepidibacter aestuarii TaxID=2925782 RepID=UPI0020BE6861|nr:AIM24 family protein [Tepidibacter aestuarii]CAH2213262.1 conserved protein of unknown function [Tepidibacter aestuarii]